MSVTVCPQCGTEVAPALLACPSCRRLVHADELHQLTREADRLTAAGDAPAALPIWRRVLDLLPPDSRQHAAVSAKVADLSRRVDAGAARAAPARPSWTRRAGIPGAIALLLWKFKALLVFTLTKAKLLLLGLTKGTTFFSMALSFGAYWTLWGWRFALGFVVSIYVHEMGHVAMLRRYGIPATAPMFIPGVGALIRARFYPNEPVAEARVGLAGPIWGMAAALAAHALHLATAGPYWAALARTGAWLNLFNLLPVWQLDGGHAFKALSRRQRWAAAGVLAVTAVLTGDGLVVVLALVAAWRAWGTSAPPREQGDARTVYEYCFTTAVLGLLIRAAAPHPTIP